MENEEIADPTAAASGSGYAAEPPWYTSYRWWVVGLLWLVCLFSYADRQAFSSVFPLLHQQMGLTKVQLGMLGSAFAIVYGLSGPFAGYVVDRIRRKTAVIGGLEVWSVVCILSAVARNFTQLVIFRAAEGLGESIYYPAALSMVSDYHGKRSRSRALGLLQTGVYVGTVGGGYVAGVIAMHHGWRASIFLFGICGSVLGLPLLWLLREPARGAAELAGVRSQQNNAHSNSQLSWKQIRSLVRIRSLLTLMGAFACSNFVALVLLTWIPTYLYNRFHLNLAMAALDAAVYPQIASIGGSILGGYLADTFFKKDSRSRIWVQCGGVLVGAPFVALCGMGGSLTVVIAALSCWGFCKGIYDSNIFAAAFDVVPVATRGTVSGLMNCVGWLIGGGTAPVAIGALATYLSLGKAVAISAVVYVVAGALLILVATCFFHGDMASAGRETATA